MMDIVVKCLCGACAVRVTADPIEQFYCHCDDCRAVTGGAYASISLHPIEAVGVLHGPVSTWVFKSMMRTFCTVCGTTLFGEPEGFGIRGVIGSLLPKEAFAPRFHQQCKFADVPINDHLPHYAGSPAMWGGSDEQIEWKK